MSAAHMTKSHSTSALAKAADRARVRREVRGLFSTYDIRKDGFMDEEDLPKLLEDLTGKVWMCWIGVPGPRTASPAFPEPAVGSVP
jgi:hypothetical protein